MGSLKVIEGIMEDCGEPGGPRPSRPNPPCGITPETTAALPSDSKTQSQELPCTHPPHTIRGPPSHAAPPTPSLEQGLTLHTCLLPCRQPHSTPYPKFSPEIHPWTPNGCAEGQGYILECCRLDVASGKGSGGAPRGGGGCWVGGQGSWGVPCMLRGVPHTPRGVDSCRDSRTTRHPPSPLHSSPGARRWAHSCAKSCNEMGGGDRDSLGVSPCVPKPSSPCPQRLLGCTCFPGVG